MSNSTNVATIVDHTGTLYAYTTRTSTITRLTRPPGGGSSLASLSVGDANVTRETGIGVALSPQSGAAPAGKRVLFWGNDDGDLLCLVDDGKSNARATGVSCAKDYRSIGVASLLAGAVTASFDGSDVIVAVWGWDGLLSGKPSASIAKRYSAAALGISSVATFKGDDGHNGSSAALASYLDAAGVPRLLLVTTWVKSDGTFRVVANVLDVDTDGDGDAVTATGLHASDPVLKATATGCANNPSALQRPDGRLMVWFADTSGVHQALATPTSGDDYGTWTTANGAGDVPALGKYSFPSALAFLPGTVATSQSPVATSLTNATVDVFDAIFRQNDDTIDGSVDNARWGRLRRTAQTPQPQREIVALGVLYGPPPVPLQNVNMPADYSNTTTSGIVSFSQTTGSTRGMSANLGSSLFGRVAGSAGYSEGLTVLGFTIASFSVKAQAEATLGASLLGTWASSATQTVATTIQSTVSLAGHAGSSPSAEGAYSIQQNGQVVGLSTSWASYVYDFVDAHGNVPAGGLSFAAVFPYQPALVLTPFVIPSGAEGPHPGDLASYQLTSRQLDDLDARAHRVGGRPYLAVSWAVGGLSAQSAETYDQSSWGVNLGLDFSAMLGAEAAADVMGVTGSVSASATWKANFGYSWTGGGSTTAQFSSSVSVPGNTSARGTFSDYAYRAYLLAESADNLRALPPGATGAGALTVSADSKPWLITYAVTSSTLI